LVLYCGEFISPTVGMDKSLSFFPPASITKEGISARLNVASISLIAVTVLLLSI